jgi:FMN phosphatase YigB (HAD superfamily)
MASKNDITNQMGVKKPNPAIFSLALEQTGLSKNEVKVIKSLQDILIIANH